LEELKMRRLSALSALVALALLPAAAQAKPRAKVYRGTFELVGADGSYTNDKFGKAHLVDGRRNDQLSVHVRRLAPKTTYAFRLEAAPAGEPACEQGAPGGSEVAGWRYRRNGLLRTNRKGNANSWARSKTFTASRTSAYFVGVYTTTLAGAPDQLVLCAELKGNRTKSKGDGRSNGDKPRGGKHQDKSGNARGQGKDKTSPGNGQGKDKSPQGDANDQTPNGHGNGNGRNKDKPRGKPSRAH
jgi:hypothetical protein